MFCPECGKKIPDDSHFCEFCGIGLDEQQPAVAVQEQPKKKSGFLKFIVVVLILALVGGGGFFLYRTIKPEISNIIANFPGREKPVSAEIAEPEPTEIVRSVKPVAEAVQISVPIEEPISEPVRISVPTKEPIPEPIIEPVNEMSLTAEKLSTKKNANASDFEWLIDITFFDGNGAGQVISGQNKCVHISREMQPLLNGGWKAFMTADSDRYSNAYERYFNAEIDTSGENFDITMNWKYLFDGAAGQSVEETGQDLFEGKWDGDSGTATAESNYGRVVLDGFCIMPDNSAEYAVGKFYWISGETYHIGLMRVLEQ